jgi:beta-lactam-binding protein with PASTA domain
MTHFAALLLRAVISIFAGLLIAGGTLTLAADRANLQRPSLAAAASTGPRTLTVPQVTGQAYVFAKSILQDHGFAWRVIGPVKGYAGNRVFDQAPAAGTVVLDTGAPTIVLSLAKNRAYAELGTPEAGAPYHGTAIRFLGTALAARQLLPKLAPRVRTAAKTGARKTAKAKRRSTASRTS